MSATKLETLTLVRLPEPWKTTYEIRISKHVKPVPLLNLTLSHKQLPDSRSPPEPLHLESLRFSDLISESNVLTPQPGDNSSWARFHQSPLSRLSWDEAVVPSVGQIWNLIYSIVTLYPELEDFRLELTGNSHATLTEVLIATGLASPPPKATRSEQPTLPTSKVSQIWISRSAFWQGAASPFGTRPAWVAHPDLFGHLSTALTLSPAFPCQYTVTFSLEGRPVHAQHPIRPPKPAHNAVIYSRYIPHLDEFFSMVHLDWRNEEHLRLFHEWQNDPRVSAGWNETGSLEQHREYLRKIDEDPHQMAILAKFDDTYFAYFEIYWAKVCEYKALLSRAYITNHAIVC